MKRYDPDSSVNPAAWLAMPEEDRLYLITKYHKRARVRMPNATVHSGIHLAVENQLAEGFEPTRRAVHRLMDEGLSRHDAVHAVGTVVAGIIYDISKGERFDDINAVMAEQLDRLDRKSWEALADDE